MTNFCKSCDVYWPSYQTKREDGKKGLCPECGGGTVRSNESASPDADARFRSAQLAREAAAERAAREAEFEAFCEKRDREALQRQLDEIVALPEVGADAGLLTEGAFFEFVRKSGRGPGQERL